MRLIQYLNPGAYSLRGLLVSVFVVVSIVGATAVAAETMGGKPQLLPPVQVPADIPLVKVAEYHLLERRFAPAAVTVGDFIYVIGGSNAGNTTLQSIERFDPRTGKSERVAKLHYGRERHGAVAVGSKIYVLGGNVLQDSPPLRVPQRDIRIRSNTEAWMAYAGSVGYGGIAPDATTEIFDVATGKVSSGPSMPDGRSFFGCVVRGEKIYVIGGRQRRGNVLAWTNTVEILDPATGKWSMGAPMPDARETTAVLVDGGFIVVPGGYNGRQALDDVAVYSPDRNGWSELAPLARHTSAASTVFLGKYLFLFGDYDSPGEILAYDLTAKTSETFTLGYQAARHGAGVTYQGRIYVFCGKDYAHNDALDLVQVFSLAPKSGTPQRRISAVSQSPAATGIAFQDVGPPKVDGKAVQFDTTLHDEILAMAVDDQKVRKNTGSGLAKDEIEEMRRVDQIHEKRMKEIIAQHGWPGKSLVGSDGSNKAWLVVQHCSPPFQEECLLVLGRAVAAGEATGKNYAYLLDRVRMNQEKPQVYGTQFRNYELWPLEDPAHVDERRRSVGLDTLAEYTEQMNKLYKKPSQPTEWTRTSVTPPAGLEPRQP